MRDALRPRVYALVCQSLKCLSLPLCSPPPSLPLLSLLTHSLSLSPSLCVVNSGAVHEALGDILKRARFRPTDSVSLCFICLAVLPLSLSTSLCSRSSWWRPQLPRSLLHILVYDLLFGNGLSSSRSAAQRGALKTIMNSRQKFSNALAQLKV